MNLQCQKGILKQAQVILHNSYATYTEKRPR